MTQPSDATQPCPEGPPLGVTKHRGHVHGATTTRNASRPQASLTLSLCESPSDPSPSLELGGGSFTQGSSDEARPRSPSISPRGGWGGAVETGSAAGCRRRRSRLALCTGLGPGPRGTGAVRLEKKRRGESERKRGLRGLENPHANTRPPGHHPRSVLNRGRSERGLRGGCSSCVLPLAPRGVTPC